MILINEANIEVYRKPMNKNTDEITINRLREYGIVTQNIGKIIIKHGIYMIFVPTNSDKIQKGLTKLLKILNNYKEILEQRKNTKIQKD